MDAVDDRQFQIWHALIRRQGKKCPVGVKRNDTHAGQTLHYGTVHDDQQPSIGNFHQLDIVDPFWISAL